MASTEPARRHVHLGTRIETADLVRRGRLSAAEAASRLCVTEKDVMSWVRSGDKPITLEDVFISPEAQRLTRRARRLVELISQADRDIRALTLRLVGGGEETQGAD